MKLIYGDGRIHTQQGMTSDSLRCLTLTQMPYAMPINSQPDKWDRQTPEERIDVILAFKNIEGARTLQDELNELIAVWSRAQGGVATTPAGERPLDTPTRVS